MKFSLVTPTFNSAKTLSRTLDSILAQTADAEFEYVVIDGGSKDGTLDILKEYEPKFGGRMRWISEPDHGIYDAVAKGFRMTSAPLMAWLGSDDLYFPHAFAQASGIFTDFPQVRWLAGVNCLVMEGGELLTLDEHMQRFGKRRHFLTGDGDHCIVMQEATFWRRELWEAAGGRFDPNLRWAGDFELWLRFSNLATLYRIPALLAAFRFSEGQASNVHMGDYYSELAEAARKERAKLPFFQRIGMEFYRRLFRSPHLHDRILRWEGMDHYTFIFKRAKPRWRLRNQ